MTTAAAAASPPSRRRRMRRAPSAGSGGESSSAARDGGMEDTSREEDGEMMEMRCGRRERVKRGGMQCVYISAVLAKLVSPIPIQTCLFIAHFPRHYRSLKDNYYVCHVTPPTHHVYRACMQTYVYTPNVSYIYIYHRRIYSKIYM
mgnify:CR=1 FL=1